MFLCHSAVLRLESFSLSLCHASAASASRKLTNQRSLSRSCECMAIVTYRAGCSESQIQLRQCLWPSVANLIKFGSCVVLIPCVPSHSYSRDKSWKSERTAAKASCVTCLHVQMQWLASAKKHGGLLDLHFQFEGSFSELMPLFIR